MNQFQEEFYQAMTRLKANSKVASTQAPKDDARITKVPFYILQSFIISSLI
jgi:hypothetical protein